MAREIKESEKQAILDIDPVVRRLLSAAARTGELSPLAIAVSHWMAQNTLTQTDVSNATGISRDRISKWLRGQRAPQLDDLRLIERSYGLPLGAFLAIAGYAEPVRGLVASINAAPELSEHNKRMLIALYHWATGPDATARNVYRDPSGAPYQVVNGTTVDGGFVQYDAFMPGHYVAKYGGKTLTEKDL